jgi:predicted aspartyl protease
VTDSKKKKILLQLAYVFAIAGWQPLFAQQAPLIAQETPIDTGPTSQDFTLDRSLRMAVDVRVNGGATVPFIVDTGAERTVIANDLAQNLALLSGPTLTLATITGRVQVPSFVIDSLQTTIVDMGGIEAPGLERANMGAYGLLGIDSLEERKILLDFKQGKIDVLPSPLSKRRSTLEDGMIVVRATRRAGRMILSNARIGGMAVDIIIDTGAQSSMGNNALRSRLRASDRDYAYLPVKMHSVTGDSVMGDYTQIKAIEIGGFGIQDLPITFSENYALEILSVKNRPAILLGMDALRMFNRVVIDFPNRRIAFELPKKAGRIK